MTLTGLPSFSRPLERANLATWRALRCERSSSYASRSAARAVAVSVSLLDAKEPSSSSSS